jgi:UDP-N-acetylmuramoyl-tripeptide--D-alanyl-D-alanine ligase
LITNVGASHLQFLKNKKGVWKEKSSLFDETIKNNGKLFINYDDPLIRNYEVKIDCAVKYSIKSRTNVYGKIKKYTYDGRPIVELIRNGRKILAELPLYGEQSVKNFVAAAAVALELGISKTNLLTGLKKIKMPAGRMNVLKLKNSILIDDTYNANPESTQAAIELLGKIKTYERKILFLGDMLELGQHEIILHEKLAKTINKDRINEVYTIGTRMKHLSQKLNRKNIIVKHFKNRKSLIIGIRNMNLKQSVILVKGSRRMHMEDFLKEVKQKVN